MRKGNNLKLLFVASSGGHFSEIYHLKEVADNYDSVLITEKTDNFSTDFSKRIFFVREINRKDSFFIFHYLVIFLKELYIFIKEKPDCVISTGALCSYPMIRIAHFFKKKTIFIESFARVFDLSKTGKKVYHFVDLFIVQWKDLLKEYPKSQYFGSFFGDFYDIC